MNGADTYGLPQVDAAAFQVPDPAVLESTAKSGHKPRILLLYGSLRERSFSRFLTLEAERLLQAFGAETRVFDPRDLPLPDAVPDDHPKVQELRALATWSEGQVWCSPERHGVMTGIMKAQIDLRTGLLTHHDRLRQERIASQFSRPEWPRRQEKAQCREKD